MGERRPTHPLGVLTKLYRGAARAIPESSKSSRKTRRCQGNAARQACERKSSEHDRGPEPQGDGIHRTSPSCLDPGRSIWATGQFRTRKKWGRNAQCQAVSRLPRGPIAEARAQRLCEIDGLAFSKYAKAKVHSKPWVPRRNSVHRFRCAEPTDTSCVRTRRAEKANRCSESPTVPMLRVSLRASSNRASAGC